ncbi:helix-turn-helix domain-containing protein [Nonomuraea africana]|uniref:helix-turn-helix domain-containing protein n=1 Tax=Nonomuraea africana TaxID=46171 RepID=UPI00178902F9
MDHEIVGSGRDEGWTLREIAAELGCPPRSVTIWLRARGFELYGSGAPVQHR